MIDPWIFGAAMVGYVFVQIAIGIYFARNVRTEADYFVGGRRLPLWPIALSLFATWFGAETVMGSSAAIAQNGLSGARAEPFGYAITLVAMGVLLAGQFRRRGYITLGDFFRDRFDRRSEVWTAGLMIIVSTIWAAAQLLALAKILEGAVGLPVGVTLPLATALVVFYTAFAGIIGDIATDVIQSVVLVVGLVILLVALVIKVGGPAAIIASVEPGQLSLLAADESWLGQIDAWAIPVLGSLVTQEAISRFLSARSADTARRASYIAAGLYLAAGMIPIVLGLAGAHLMPVGEDTDAFLPALATTLLPPMLLVVFLAALFSAILSTTDSNILSVSSFVSVNIFSDLHRSADEATRARVARWTTVAAGLAAWVIASSGQTIYELIALTSVWGQAGILVAVLIGLWSPYGGPRAALWAILVCVAVNLWTLAVMPVMTLIGAGETLGMAMTQLVAGEAPTMEGYFLVSLVASLIAYAAGAEMDKRAAAPPQPAEQP
jgi:SSS family transporter